MLVIGQQAGRKDNGHQGRDDYPEFLFLFRLDMGEGLADEHGVFARRLIGFGGI